MRRKSFWLSVGLVVMMASAVVVALVLLTQHVPAFYIRSAVAPGPQRKKVSGEFSIRSNNFIETIKNPTASQWGELFSEEEINSFFEEDFLTFRLAEKLLPEGVSEPRIAFEQDRIRLGFRYESALWHTTISMDFRVWLARGEPNVVVIQLKGVHAGSLPISAQSLLEDISEALRRHGIQVSWYRHEGNPTATLKFQSEQVRPTCQLLQLDFKPGTLTIVGHSNDVQ